MRREKLPTIRTLPILLCAAVALAFITHAQKAEAVIRLNSSNTAALSQGLVGYWTFDGPVTNWTSNTTQDISGNGNTLSMVGLSTTTSPIPGHIGQALLMPANASMSIPITSSLEPQTLTISAWVKFSDFSQTVTIRGTGGTTPYFFSTEAGVGSVEFAVANFRCDLIKQGPDLNSWGLTTLTFDGTNLAYYLNGALISSTTQCAGSIDYGSATKFQVYHIVSAYPGIVDDLRVYNRALSAAEVQQLYHLGQATPKGTLLQPWQDRKGAGTRAWSSITSSSDGNKLAATVFGGYIYTSTDGGGTWTERTNPGSHQWNCIATSADGTKLAAVTTSLGGDDIFTSTNSGSTWTDQTTAGARRWIGIASSADGTKLVAVATGDSGAYIYTSTDSGANWTEHAGPGLHFWGSAASSADGMRLAAAENGGHIWTSTDGGSNWTDQTNSGFRYWKSVTSSSDGRKLAAVEAGGDDNDVRTSSDGGVTWTTRTAAGSHSWQAITSSSDGTKLAAADNTGYIYTSSNSGLNWTQQTAGGSRSWYTITSSSDGSKLAAAIGISNSGDIYTTKAAVTNIGHSNVQIGNGLVGYWTFDGPSVHWDTGRVDDISGNNNAGQLINMSTTTSGAIGKIGQALAFNLGPQVAVTSGSILGTINAITLTAWVKNTNPTAPSQSGGGIFALSSIHLSLGLDGGQLFAWITNDVGWHPAATSLGFTDWNKWHFVAETYDGAKLLLYRDGIQVAVSGSETGAIPASTEFDIGGHDSGASVRWSGTIDDVRYYNRVLSAAEIKQLYGAGR